MIHSDSLNILLVHPPVASPAAPPWVAAHIAASLVVPGITLDPYDANLDFFLNHLLNPKRLSAMVDQIEMRKNRGIFKAADSEDSTLLESLIENPSDWKRTIASASHSREILKGEDFYRPESATTALKDIKDLLALNSLAFYPSRIQWNRFENASVKNWADVRGFAVDTSTNPFLSLCESGLAPRLTRRKQDLLIFTVASPLQTLAALTMARFSKKTSPRLHVALSGDLKSLDGAEAYVDTLLPGTDPGSLLELIGSFSKGGTQTERMGTTEANFSQLPVKDYLTPSLVLPYRLQLTTGSGVLSPTRLLSTFTTLTQTLGAKGFLIEDPPLPTSYVAELARKMADEKVPFCLGITCTLSGLPDPEIMNSAQQSGIKFIRWRDPAGQISELSKILWKTSKAGIWNHVEIPEARDGRLSQELTQYINANPNIAHSWEHPQSFSSSLGCPPQRSDNIPQPYGQVTNLPGSPFWHELNDPAHLLLYLNRHSLKKVLRWRVREKGRSIYALGEDLDYHFVRPQQLPPGYLDEICRMVEAGGSVATQWVRHNLERAFLIGYVMEQGVIVGNSSLKHPRREYVERVNRLAGLDISDYLERGYTSVRPEYRGLGIGTKLLEGLTARVGKRKLFSIITADNVGTQKIALRNKTKQVASFYSDRLGKEVGVWVPEWMIENDHSS